MGSSARIIRCYIEEYDNEDGLWSARLREKKSAKKVDLGFVDEAMRQHFLAFLNAANRSRSLLPDLFTKDGDADCILVSGDLDFDAPDEIRFVPNGQLSYLFG